VARTVAILPGEKAQTQRTCPFCNNHHIAKEGITAFYREFICSGCGEQWTDVWCVACNDRCPRCGLETEPEPGVRSRDIEQAVID
jgi:hypothetical protein